VAQYSIKDVEQLTGVKAHTLRIWEQRYNSVQPYRTDTNIRYYDDQQLKFLINVALLMKHGKKISKIFELSGDQMKFELRNLNTNSLSGDKYAQLMTDALVISMLELDEVNFEKNIADATLKYGFEDCMMKVVIPFLSKIGILWMTNEVDIAQEHFISNLIRRKLLVAIDGNQVIAEPQKKFLLFLPDKETHEMGLLFAHYLIKRRGHHVMYLGQSVPLSDLSKVDKIYKSDYLLTYVTISQEGQGEQVLVNGLEEAFPGKPIYFCGPVGATLQLRSESNIQPIKRVQDLVDTLNKIL
jgi:DNA-binding transcriptional MerR regulator